MHLLVSGAEVLRWGWVVVINWMEMVKWSGSVAITVRVVRFMANANWLTGLNIVWWLKDRLAVGWVDCKLKLVQMLVTV